MIEDQMDKVPEPKEKEVRVDLEIPLCAVSEKLADLLQELTPFGIGNPTPVFQSNGKISFVKTMGKKQQHLKFALQDLEVRTKCIECVYFSPNEEQREKITSGATLSISYTIEAQYWQGKKQLKCFVKIVA